LFLYINIKDSIITPLKIPYKNKVSGRKLGELIKNDPRYAAADSIKKYYNLSDNNIYNKINNIDPTYPKKKLQDTIQYILGSSFSSKHYIGWTTTGHTAEDVFLAIHAPEGVNKLTGVVANSDIGKYIAEEMNLGNLKDSTEKYFCYYKNLQDIDINQVNQDSLVIKKDDTEAVIYANTNKIKITRENKTTGINLPTIAVCIMNKNNKFDYYISRLVLDYL
jgi:alkaline phosphatase